MFDALFRLLFKYRPVVFERGDLVLAVSWPVVAVLLIVAGVAVVAYARRRGSGRLLHRAILLGLRLGALAVLGLCLARPMLVISTVVPQQNFLGILIDDSRSMRIAEQADRPRSAFVQERLAGEASELLADLSQRFKLRFFRFAETAERLGDLAELSFAGRRTDLGRALDAARRELGAVPLAGLVMVTDGANNAGESLTESLIQLHTAGVPVYTVGVGETRLPRDIALGRASTPRRVLRGSSVAVDLAVSQSGYGGRTVPLTVEAGGRIVSGQDVELGREAEASVRAYFTAEEPGAQVFRFRIAPQDGETVRENNVVEAVIEVEDARRRILYFEGEPRFEVKFMRRALAEDHQLQLVVLQRTAEEKYLRLDVADPTELAGGFPKTREELFRYDGLVLGSVEASLFTLDQLRMIAEFVGQRGGGLLALGGRRGFAEGGYAGTPVADALPVVLESAGSGNNGGFFAEVKVELTPFGRGHPTTQLAGTVVESEERWRTLPALSTLNPLTRVKPGASTLLVGRTEESRQPLVVLAAQRYGRGKALAFAVQDSWLWQMHADIPLDDLTHETWWRQLLRWLVSDVAAPVTALVSADRVERGDPMVVTAEIADSGYVRVNGADVSATIVAPSGAERTVPLEWTVVRDGEYRGSSALSEDGLHQIRVTARQDGVPLGEDVSYVQVGDLGSEYVDAEMQRVLLERIADETGGRFYTPATVAALPEDMSFTESGATVYEERDLWDMPVLLLLLVGLVGAEWVYRRRQGLA